MTPTQQKLALRLYKRYQTTGREYRELAASLGLQITDLNQICWRINHAQKATV